MSGHSKWATTKRQKAVTDAKRSSAFTKLSHAITIAARGGGDPKSNFTLRLAIDKAREVSMPKENIDRAIKRGTGELEGATIEEIMYEGYGPGGVAILIETLTDNRNRTVSEVKHILSKNGGSLGAAGSVAWMFEKKGVLGVDSKNFSDETELAVIEAGAEDIIREDEGLTIITTPENFPAVKETLESLGIETAFAEINYRAKTTVSADEELSVRIQKILDDLESLDDVQNYYSNLA